MKTRLFSSINAAMEAGHSAEASHLRYASKNPAESGGGGWSDLFEINATLTPEFAGKALKVQYVRDGKFCEPYVYVPPAEHIAWEGGKPTTYNGPVESLKGTPIDDTSKLDLVEDAPISSSSGATGAPEVTEEKEKDLRATASAAAAESGGKRRGGRPPAAGPRAGRGMSTLISEQDAILSRMAARSADIAVKMKEIQDLNAEQNKDQKALSALVGEAEAAQRSTSELLASLL